MMNNAYSVEGIGFGSRIAGLVIFQHERLETNLLLETHSNLAPNDGRHNERRSGWRGRTSIIGATAVGVCIFLIYGLVLVIDCGFWHLLHKTLEAEQKSPRLLRNAGSMASLFARTLFAFEITSLRCEVGVETLLDSPGLIFILTDCDREVAKDRGNVSA